MAKVSQYCFPSGPTACAANTVLYQSTSQQGSDPKTPASIRQQTYRTAGVLSQLYAYVVTNTVTATSTFASFINSNPGNLTLSVPSSTTGQFQDTTHSDTVAAGDVVVFRITVGATGTSLGLQALGSLFEASNSCTQRICSAGSGGTNFSVNASVYPTLPIGQLMALTSITPKLTTVAPFTWQMLSTIVATNTRSASCTIKSRINNVLGNQSISIGAAATGSFEDTTHSDLLAAGDYFEPVVNTTGGSGNIALYEIGSEILSVQSRFMLACGAPNQTGWASATHYLPIAGALNDQTTEAVDQVKALSNFIASGFSCYIRANAATSTSTARVRQNGANTSMVVSVSAAATGLFQDSTNYATVLAGDLLAYSCVAGGTGTFSPSWFAVTGQDAPLAPSWSRQLPVPPSSNAWPQIVM